MPVDPEKMAAPASHADVALVNLQVRRLSLVVRRCLESIERTNAGSMIELEISRENLTIVYDELAGQFAKLTGWVDDE